MRIPSIQSTKLMIIALKGAGAPMLARSESGFLGFTVAEGVSGFRKTGIAQCCLAHVRHPRL